MPLGHRLGCQTQPQRLVGTRLLWTQTIGKSSGRVKIYESTSHDPVLNLSVEHRLLQQSHPDSAILFLYCNRPSVIIGRNQNPWLEVNLQHLKSDGKLSSAIGKVDLVRRRSGGGAVFHDPGNVNWTVISPSESFTRDKHVEMVVRALRSIGVDRARVNKRHDIVLDTLGGIKNLRHDPNDTHMTPFTQEEGGSVKVSGSAYKLTRGRALHHGTCLLSTPNLSVIPQYLHSPARGIIQAKGVESVSSPVGNIGVAHTAFYEAVQHEFTRLYGSGAGKMDVIQIGEESKQDEHIMKGIEEMQGPTWMWEQTPQFSLSYTPRNDSDAIVASLSFRHGKVEEANISTSHEPQRSRTQGSQAKEALQTKGISWMQASSWAEVLQDVELDHEDGSAQRLFDWLDKVLPTPVSLGLFL